MCASNQGKKRAVDEAAGVHALGTIRNVSARTVDIILERARSNRDCLLEGPQSDKHALQGLIFFASATAKVLECSFGVHIYRCRFQKIDQKYRQSAEAEEGAGGGC